MGATSAALLGSPLVQGFYDDLPPVDQGVATAVCVHAGLICGIAQNSLSQIEARDQEEAR